jgi:hypothetical protein
MRPWMAGNVMPQISKRRLHDKAAVSKFLHEEGLHPYSLTPQEATEASQTPDITANCFNEIFGGRPAHERRQLKGASIICINPRLQNFGPSSPGKPGLLFLVTNPIPPEAEAQEPSLVFLQVPRPTAVNRRYRYLGTYIRVPVSRTTIGADEWLALPNAVSSPLFLFCAFIAGASGCHFLMPLPKKKCRTLLSGRMYTLLSPDVRALHARLTLRRRLEREPSSDEVETWLTENTGRPKGIKQTTIAAAYSTGEEVCRYCLFYYQR